MLPIPYLAGIRTVDASEYVDLAEIAVREQEEAAFTKMIGNLAKSSGAGAAAGIHELLKPLMASAERLYEELVVYQEFEPVYSSVEEMWVPLCPDLLKTPLMCQRYPHRLRLCAMPAESIHRTSERLGHRVVVSLLTRRVVPWRL